MDSNKKEDSVNKTCTQKNGKQLNWKELDSLGAAKAIAVLLDREINGSRQKRADWNEQLKKSFDKNMESVTRKYYKLKDARLIYVLRRRSGIDIV